ncbi:MAG: hypothetical protein V4754_18955 [Pseudomonadota bacterium]
MGLFDATLGSGISGALGSLSGSATSATHSMNAARGEAITHQESDNALQGMQNNLEIHRLARADAHQKALGQIGA